MPESAVIANVLWVTASVSTPPPIATANKPIRIQASIRTVLTASASEARTSVPLERFPQ